MSDLHTISLLFRGGQRQANLVFSSAERAKEVFDVLTAGAEEEDGVSFSDSFGTTIYLIYYARSPLEAVILQDAGRASEGGIEMGLLQTRAQTKAQRRAAGDPMINLNSTRALVPGGH
jgi:hypothetical protein